LALKKNRTFFRFFEELKNIENRVAWFLAKKVCKKTSETSAGQSLLGGI
jgi:hypothetical protein